MRAVSVSAALLALSACMDTSDEVREGDTGSEFTCVEGLLEGECAPDFMLPEASGAEVALSDHAGDVVLVASEAMW